MNTATITKTDQAMLAHLTPLDGADTYLCGISKYNKDDYIWTVEAKVKAWVERNGGTMKRLHEEAPPVCIGERKGYRVQIRFPTYTKRDMKNIMATLFDPKKKMRPRGAERSL